MEQLNKTPTTGKFGDVAKVIDTNFGLIVTKLMELSEASKVKETNSIDLSLIDNKGNERNLSSLKGKVVILDFHSFEGEGSAQRIMTLRSLYNKYHAQGLEIYQVGMGTNEHFWKTSVAALPWVCVYDKSGTSAVMYNVQSIPTFFILDREGTPVKRDVQVKDIDKEIQSLL